MGPYDSFQIGENRIVALDKTDQRFVKNWFAVKRIFHSIFNMMGDFIFNGLDKPLFINDVCIRCDALIQLWLLGIADPAEVDEAIKNSFGLRLPVLGPMENADLVGLDLTHAIHDYVLGHIEDSHAPSPILKEKIDKGELGIKVGKGFQEWPEEKADALRKGLVNHLLKWMKEH